MSDPIAEAATQAAIAIDRVCALVDANELERQSIRRLGDLTRHGYKTIDIKVRVDGRETWIEGDWLARLLRGSR